MGPAYVRAQVSRVAAPAVAAVAVALIGTQACASLGQGVTSVQADRARLAAGLKSEAAATHTVHTLSLANGGVVREYANPAGVVFAVSWRGRGRPDLHQLLGPSFDTLQAGFARGAGRRARAPLTLDRDSLVVHSGGHPGAFWGVAYLPQDIPAGFTASDLK